MILGFAHLAVNVDDLDTAENYWQSKGYSRNALYLNTPNHPSKQLFLTNYQPFHDLMLMSGSGLWPLEITRHGSTDAVNTQMEWDRNAIRISVPNPACFQRLLIDGLGFSEDDGDLILKSRLPSWFCRLRLVAGDCLPTSLSAEGPSCLAFYCNRITEDANKLIELGATDYTNEFELTLGERAMTIAMMRLPGGPLLELINPRKKI